MNEPVKNDVDQRAPRKLHKPARANEMKPGEIVVYNCEACGEDIPPDGTGMDDFNL